MSKVELKPLAEVKAKLREMLHRAADRFVKANLIPKPENCAHAPRLGNRVQPCGTCGARPGEECKIESQFQARYTFPELKAMFRDLAENREWLLRTHRDIAMLLWVLNQLEPSEEPDPAPLPTQMLATPEVHGPPWWVRMDGDVLRMSPAAAASFTTVLSQFMTQGNPNAEVLERRDLGDKAEAPHRLDRERL